MKYKRTHIIFDVYNPSSLKMKTRSKRGQGGRRQVTNKNKVPSNRCNFLRHNDNKTDLFHFLADKITHLTVPNMVVVTKGPNVLSTFETCLGSLDKCFQEEADSRIHVHGKHVTTEGGKSIVIKANDTDIIVIAFGIFPSLQEHGLQQLWVTFGYNASLRWIGVHNLCSVLGPLKTKGRPCIHRL